MVTNNGNDVHVDNNKNYVDGGNDDDDDNDNDKVRCS
mgnify:CR=1 FL=1